MKISEKFGCQYNTLGTEARIVVFVLVRFVATRLSHEQKNGRHYRQSSIPHISCSLSLIHLLISKLLKTVLESLGLWLVMLYRLICLASTSSVSPIVFLRVCLQLAAVTDSRNTLLTAPRAVLTPGGTSGKNAAVNYCYLVHQAVPHRCWTAGSGTTITYGQNSYLSFCRVI